MWYSAEPLSPSSWLNAQVPIRRPTSPLVDRHRERVRADHPGGEEPLDLLGPHRRFLVAREAGDLGVRVPAPEGREVLRRRGGAAPPRPCQDLREPRSRRHRPNGIPSPPCAAGASSPSAWRRPPGRPRRPPCSPTTSARSTPEELPIAAVFLTGRPFPEADQRAAGLGWSAIVGAVGALAGVDPRGPRRGLRPTLRPRPRRRGRPDAGADTRRRPASADPPRGRRRVRRDRGRLRVRAARRRSCATLLDRSDPLTAKAIVKVLGGELRIGLREGLVEAAIAKAFDRPLDEVKWAGHAHRRHRPARRASRGTTRSATQSSRCSTRSSSCSRHPPRTPTRSSPAWAPRSGSRTSTTASGPSSTSAARRPALLARPARHQQRSSPRSSRRPGRWPGTGSSMARSWPGKDGAGPPVHHPPDPARTQDRRPRRSAPRSRSSTSPSTSLALGPGNDAAGRTSSRSCANRSASAGRRLDALDLPLVERRRPVRPVAPLGRRRRRRPRDGVRRCARSTQRGVDGQGSRERLLARPARAGLAEDEEGTGHHRLRRGRRRGRPRQAARRPERLHVCRSRYRRPASSSTSARPTAA